MSRYLRKSTSVPAEIIIVKLRRTKPTLLMVILNDLFEECMKNKLEIFFDISLHLLDENCYCLSNRWMKYLRKPGVIAKEIGKNMEDFMEGLSV